MNDIGLYLSTASLYAVRVQGDKVVSFNNYPLITDLGASEEDEGVKLEVLLNKVARELNITKEDNLYLAVEDKYLIFRSFIAPHMNKAEIESTIVFEIEKYIPFKIENLIWNYSCKKLPREKKLVISFVGIKKTTFDKLYQPFAKLGLNLSLVESSGLVLLRLVRSLSACSKLGWFALLDLTSEECYLNFFYHTLPVFSRTIFSSKREALSGYNLSAGLETLDTDKFVDEINFSFHYFYREFRPYHLEKMVILLDEDNSDLIASLKKGLDIEKIFIGPQEILNVQDLKLEPFKAYGSAVCDSFPNKFTPFLENTSTCFLGSVKRQSKLFNFPLLGGIIIFGIFVLFFLNVTLQRRIEVKEEFLEKKKAGVNLPKELKQESLEKIKSILAEKGNKIKTINKKAESLINIASIFEKLPLLITKGLWLENLEIKSQGNGNLAMQISGYVYLNNSAEEGNSLDEFIANMNGAEEIKGILPTIDLLSKDRQKFKGYETTYFRIKLY